MCNTEKSKIEERIATMFKFFTDSLSVKPARNLMLKKIGMNHENVIKTPINRNSRQYKNLMKLNLKEINKQTESFNGIILSREKTLGTKIEKEDIKDLEIFYEYIAKGIMTLKVGKILNWEDCSIVSSVAHCPEVRTIFIEEFDNVLKQICTHPDGFMENWNNNKNDVNSSSFCFLGILQADSTEFVCGINFYSYWDGMVGIRMN